MLGTLLACGQPEDVLVIKGGATDEFGEPVTTELTLYRDTGATALGCTAFSKWQTLTTDADGGFSLQHTRQETAGRFGLNRCLRLEWKRGELTNSFSWLGRPRDTQLRALPVTSIFENLQLTLPVASGDSLMGGVSLPVDSLEVRDARGVIFRQATSSVSEAAIRSGPGFAPAFRSTVVSRVAQRAQQLQPNDLGQDPFIQLEYRTELDAGVIDGNPALLELAHGKPCTVQQPGVSVCALTDGLFMPVDLPDGTQSVDVLVSEPVHTVVVRGIGSRDRFNAVAVDRVTANGAEPSGRTRFDSALELLSTLEDTRQGGYVIVHWTGAVEPIERLRVRLEADDGTPVDIGWLSEISVY